MTPTLQDVLFADDVAEMRSLAEEWAFSRGPVGDLARYLICALDENQRLLGEMARSEQLHARKVAAYRLKKRTQMRIVRGRLRLHPQATVAKRQRTPNPISDREVEEAMAR